MRKIQRISALLLATLTLMSSCGKTEDPPAVSSGVWHSVTLREYAGVIVREIYPLESGVAAVYYDMAAEDYAYDLFSYEDEYLGTIRPSEFSGCPKAWRITVPSAISSTSEARRRSRC